MAKDPYQILGVDRAASDKEIKSAYRRLSKQCHPDLNPGDKKASERFHEISAAYQLLSDDKKRAAYDRGEVDSDGHEKQSNPFYYHYADGPDGKRYYHEATGHFDPKDIEDLFGTFFSGGMAGQEAGFKQRASDAYYSVEIDFIEAAKGCTKRVKTTDGKVLDVRVPVGVEDGQRLRLKGQGGQGAVNMPAGDAFIDVHIKPHAWFRRKGVDIYVDVPISLDESILGGKIRIPTVNGAVEMSIPKGSNTGDILRLKNKGIKGEGHQYVVLQVKIPDTIDADLEDSIKKWTEKHRYNPRESMEKAA